MDSGFSDSGSRLTAHNLRKKNSAEGSLGRPAGMSNEGEPSGPLESIAESSWDEESEADSMPFPPYPSTAFKTRYSLLTHCHPLCLSDIITKMSSDLPSPVGASSA